MKINVEFSKSEFELIAEAIKLKVKTDEVQQNGILISKYMNIYDKANCIATLLKIRELEKIEESHYYYEDEEE